MNPKLCKRLAMTESPPQRTRRISLGSDEHHVPAKASVRDEAALLLSIADIAKSELRFCDMDDLWKEDDKIPILPKFPRLSSIVKAKGFPTRKQSLSELISSAPQEILYPANRIRSVSIDTPNETSRARTPSPMTPSPSVMVTPIQPPRLTIRKVRRSAARAKTYQADIEETSPRASSFADQKNGPLQGACPAGVPIKKILRRKFSWKNYPELEQFLIANREEYLRHSALNYTVQQKQYNNRLTDRLLELATEHGYVFEEKEFSFVTVRDRIRCYYKSYVQSAKKRGVLMGYAARKAGLLSDKDLSAGKAGQIIIP